MPPSRAGAYQICWSSPLREAWIEIPLFLPAFYAVRGRLPYGRRGLKYFAAQKLGPGRRSRLPYGRRGLKYIWVIYLVGLLLSSPLREAWIEIPHRREISPGTWSSPLREAWIEITVADAVNVPAAVVSLTGGVD